MSEHEIKSRDTTNIDWRTIWESLDWDDTDRQQEAIRERLKQRAQQYAQPAKHQTTYQEDREEAYQLLTFRLGSERYGVDVRLVTSVRSIGKMTRVPGAPSFYRGVVNIRGQIVTVLDLRIMLSLGMDTSELPPELIVVENQMIELAILADHVSDVERIPVDAVEPIEMKHAHGVTSNRLVVLDIEQLLSDERLFVGGVDA